MMATTPVGPDLPSLDRRYREQASWTRGIRRELLAQAGVANGTRLLDIGAGTGAILADLLQTYTAASTVAVDIDLPSLAYAKQHLTGPRFVAGDGLALPFQDRVFDVAYFHFVLVWLGRPVQALREARRVTRPGGFILALAEPDHEGRIDAPNGLEALGRLQTDALARQGADTHFGRKLRASFEAAGLGESRVGVLGGEWTSPGNQALADSEWSVLRTDLAGSLSSQELNRLEAADRQAWAEGHRVLFVPTFYALGRVP